MTTTEDRGENMLLEDVVTLVREQGPAASPGDPARSLARARQMLAREISAASGGGARAVTRRRRQSRWVAFPAAAALGLGVAGVAVVVSGPGTTSQRETAALVTFAMPQLPVSFGALPDGVTDEPVFTGERYRGRFWLFAGYPGRAADDGVGLRVDDHTPDDVEGQAQHLQVAGHPATLVTSTTDGGAPLALVRWERQPGQWITVQGSGVYGTAAVVQSLTAGIRDIPLVPPMRIWIAPAGWSFRGMKDNTILTLTGRRPREELTVQRTDRPDPDFARSVAGPGVTALRVSVGGLPGDLVRGPEAQVLQVRLADGSAYELQAPLSFPVPDVVELASQVQIVR